MKVRKVSQSSGKSIKPGVVNDESVDSWCAFPLVVYVWLGWVAGRHSHSGLLLLSTSLVGVGASVVMWHLCHQ
jgi:hypothetical protein